MAGVAGADIDADKSATLDGYRVCQVKPRAAPACLLAYKNHLFYPAQSSAIEKEDDSMAHYGTHWGWSTFWKSILVLKELTKQSLHS